MMKIIKRTSDNVVIFAGDGLELIGTVCSGPGWTYRNPDQVPLMIEDVDALPDDFITGGWSYSGGVWQSNAIATAKIMPEKRAEKTAEIYAAFAAATTANIDFNAFMWKTDAASVALLAQVISVGSVPPGMYWRDASNTPRAMAFADLQALGYAILARNLAADDNHQTKLAAINAAATPAEIELIIW